jgi:TolB-like protein/DNA-binding winged helix-turn-helix (wHTH) protein/tetratricopeptide (TPR) repeat protein
MPDGFRIGSWLVEPSLNSVTCDGKVHRLEPKMMEVLVCLAQNQRVVVSKEQLMRVVWPDTFVTDDVLTRCISELRRALEDDPKEPSFIETIPKRGYRLLQPVEPIKGRAQNEQRSIRTWLLAGIAAVVATLILVFWGYKHPFGGTAAVRIQSIAVLPLENLSGDPSQQSFADGITDALTTSLAQLRGIRVISRTSAMHYKGTKKTLPEIARELGVDAVVEGSASRAGEVIHVNAQLIYVPGDSHIWAHSYEGAASGLFAMESEIANDLTRKIGATTPLEPSEDLSRAVTVNSEAYDLYLRAEPYYGLETREANDQAIRLLEKSVEMDPQFAAAYAALATAYRIRAFSVEINDSKWVEKASAAVGKALALNPHLPQAYVSRGYLLWSRANGWAHERAVSDYRYALELNPNLAEAHHQLANVYNHVGLLEKAQGEIQKAVTLDPLNTGSRLRVAITLLYQGKYEESLVAMRDSEKFYPPLIAFQTSFTLQHLGRRQEAEESIDASLKRTPVDAGGSLTAMQALLTADAGDVPLAERKIQEALVKGKDYQHFHHITYAVASAYALLDRREQALQYLRLTAEDGFPCYPLFEHDSNLNHLRNDPRFLSFLAEQKKQWEYFREHL